MIGFAKKIGMTRIFVGETMIPVTVLEFPEQYVLQTKTLEIDGYNAIQIGAFKKKKVNSPAKGQLQKYILSSKEIVINENNQTVENSEDSNEESNSKIKREEVKSEEHKEDAKNSTESQKINFGFKIIGEFKKELESDQKILNISQFSVDKYLDVRGKSIGKGFAGAVKRHGFAGQPASHGHDHERAVGSIGARWPQRTLPGTRMAGRMGGRNATVKSLKIVAIDTDKNLLFLKGSIPGSNGSIVSLQPAYNKLKVK